MPKEFDDINVLNILETISSYFWSVEKKRKSKNPIFVND